jgi:hypothetical protein
MVSSQPRVVVVRDGETSVVHNPPPLTFGRASNVTYVHVSELNAAPEGSHYFVNCARVDAGIYALCNRARRNGTQITFIVRHVDLELARYVDEMNASLIPAYGIGHQITQATLSRIAQRVLRGHRVVAEGFVSNSLGLSMRNQCSRDTVVRHLMEASRLADGSTSVVAAVLSLHRSGSNYLRDLIGVTVSGRVHVFHEHEIPRASEVTRDHSVSCVDQALLEADWARARLLRRACLRDMIVNAGHRLIFVTERAPDDRLMSYFQRRHLAWLGTLYDRRLRVLRDVPQIQRRFEDWLKRSVRSQRKWYRRSLGDTFGLNVLEAERSENGCRVGQRGTNTLLVVPTTRLNALRDALVSACGSHAAYASIASNSVRVSRRGDEIDRVFRRDIRFPESMIDALWEIPEVACLHPRPGAGRPDTDTKDDEMFHGKTVERRHA